MISEVCPACQVDPARQVDLRVEAALRAKSTLRAKAGLESRGMAKLEGLGRPAGTPKLARGVEGRVQVLLALPIGKEDSLARRARRRSETCLSKGHCASSRLTCS